jgi:hypothetical protein
VKAPPPPPPPSSSEWLGNPYPHFAITPPSDGSDVSSGAMAREAANSVALLATLAVYASIAAEAAAVSTSGPFAGASKFGRNRVLPLVIPRPNRSDQSLRQNPRPIIGRIISVGRGWLGNER